MTVVFISVSLKQRYKKETVWETVLCKKEQIWAKKKSISGGSQIYNYLIYRLLLVFICSCFLWKIVLWFWKLITTRVFFRLLSDPLFIKPKIQFLKANHNRKELENRSEEVVYKAKDTIFEFNSEKKAVFFQRQLSQTQRRLIHYKQK